MKVRGLGGERGSVVAEFAIALPAVALVLLLGVGALAAGAEQVRLQDAAADAARLVARGETEARARDVVADASPGATLSIQRRDGLVCVEVRVAALHGLALRARSCALEGGW